MILVEWEGKAYGTNRRLEANRYGTIYKNPGYRGFQEGLTWMLRGHDPDRKPFKGDVKVHLDFTINQLRDIDSLVKPVLDCLETAGVIHNDRQIRVLIVTKFPKKKRRQLDKIRIAVEQLPKQKEKKLVEKRSRANAVS